MYMTYDEYDALTEKFEKIKESKKVPVCWPTVQQIDSFEDNPDKWLIFCCYLHDYNPEPQKPGDKYSKRNLASFIGRHLELVDSEDDYANP